MRASSDRLVSREAVPKGTLVSDTAASRGSRTMRTMRAPGQVSEMSCQVRMSSTLRSYMG